jgi:DsbC/DsbD-like thiol-disulfide interchange protein
MLRAASHLLTIAAIALPCIPGMARAQDSSAWDAEPHAAARLIAGGAQQSADAAWLRAGIEIRLDTGWKTYWRYPGDSGVPPTLDFAGSDNVKAVTVLWPAPMRFADGAGGHSIGYHGDIVLPLRVLANDAAKPAALHLKLGYAVCSNLCVPVDAVLDLTLSGKRGTEEATLAAAEARVPRRATLGAGRVAGGLAIRSAHRERGSAGDRVVVEVEAPAGTPVDLFAEGPTPDWALPLPDASGGGDARTRRFTFDLDGLPPGAHVSGATLTLTATSPDDAIEVPVHLD